MAKVMQCACGWQAARNTKELPTTCPQCGKALGAAAPAAAPEAYGLAEEPKPAAPVEASAETAESRPGKKRKKSGERRNPREAELECLQAELQAIRRGSVGEQLTALHLGETARGVEVGGTLAAAADLLAGGRVDRFQDNMERVGHQSEILHAAKGYSRTQARQMLQRQRALTWLADSKDSLPNQFACWGFALPVLATAAGGQLLALVVSFVSGFLAVVLALASALVAALAWRSLTPLRRAMADYPHIRKVPEDALARSPAYVGACLGLAALAALAFLLLAYQLIRGI